MGVYQRRTGNKFRGGGGGVLRLFARIFSFAASGAKLAQRNNIIELIVS